MWHSAEATGACGNGKQGGEGYGPPSPVQHKAHYSRLRFCSSVYATPGRTGH